MLSIMVILIGVAALMLDDMGLLFTEKEAA